MTIDRISLARAWSFGDSIATFRGFKNRAVIIGKNNAGKSNVLRPVSWLMAHLRGAPGQPLALDASDVYALELAQPQHKPHFSIQFSVNDDEWARFYEPENLRKLPQNLSNISFLETFRSELNAAAGGKVLVEITTTKEALALTGGLSAALRQRRGDDNDPISAAWKSHFRPLFEQFFASLLLETVHVLDGWRSLRNDNSALIRALRTMKTPDPSDRAARRRFHDVQEFFRRVTGLGDAELLPDPSQDRLNIDFAKKYLPIGAFGDGIQHLLMLAIHLASSDNHILLLEEPETHLHPAHQRHMLTLLDDFPSNQILLTTHSPVLLDWRARSCIFRVDYDGECSTIEKCSDTHYHAVLDSLGVRPSDLLQANVVIWVEGPTDRMFLNRCFQLLEAPWVEGIHYQILFYGGRLLSHITLDDELKELVQVLSVCRRAAVICDRDTDTSGAPITQTKERLKLECVKKNCLFWLTEGRELENYVPDEVIRDVYSAWFGETAAALTLGKFEKIDMVIAERFPEPARGNGWRTRYGENKAAIMPEFLKHMSNSSLDQHRLREQLICLSKFIGEGNPPAINLKATTSGCVI